MSPEPGSDLGVYVVATHDGSWVADCLNRHCTFTVHGVAEVDTRALAEAAAEEHRAMLRRNTTPDDERQAVAKELLTAADLVDNRCKEATPGPWWRPLNTRWRNVIRAFVPEGEQGYHIGGFDDEGNRDQVGVLQANIWSSGKFTRSRSGRDLEWAALMDPRVGPFLAALMRREAGRVTRGLVADADVLGIARVVLSEKPGQWR